jgi:hypothetical protein
MMGITEITNRQRKGNIVTAFSMFRLGSNHARLTLGVTFHRKKRTRINSIAPQHRQSRFKRTETEEHDSMIKLVIAVCTLVKHDSMRCSDDDVKSGDPHGSSWSRAKSLNA